MIQIMSFEVCSVDVCILYPNAAVINEERERDKDASDEEVMFRKPLRREGKKKKKEISSVDHYRALSVWHSAGLA